MDLYNAKEGEGPVRINMDDLDKIDVFKQIDIKKKKKEEENSG